MTVKVAVDEVEALTHLGLTSTQGKVYLATLQAGASTAKTISTLSGLSQGTIYHVMPALQSLRLIERLTSMPAVYRAASIRDGFSILLEFKIGEYAKLVEGIERLIHSVKKNAKEPSNDSPNNSMVVSKGSWCTQIPEIFGNVKTSLDIIVPWMGFSQFAFVFTEVAKCSVSGNVLVRVVTAKPPNENPIAKGLSAGDLKSPRRGGTLNVRYVSAAFSAVIVICDGKEVCLTTSSSPLNGDKPMLWTKNAYLLAIAQDYFETLWAISTVDNEPKVAPNNPEQETWLF